MATQLLLTGYIMKDFHNEDHITVFANTYRRISETDNLHHKTPRANNQHHRVEVDLQILYSFEVEPTMSIRKVTEQLNLADKRQ